VAKAAPRRSARRFSPSIWRKRAEKPYLRSSCGLVVLSLASHPSLKQTSFAQHVRHQREVILYLKPSEMSIETCGAFCSDAIVNQ
jgi:hypothetical protein